MDFYGASGIPILWCCFFQVMIIMTSCRHKYKFWHYVITWDASPWALIPSKPSPFSFSFLPPWYFRIPMYHFPFSWIWLLSYCYQDFSDDFEKKHFHCRQLPLVGFLVWRSLRTALSRWPASSPTSTGRWPGGSSPPWWWPSSSSSTASDGSRWSTGRWSTPPGRTPSASSCPSPPWSGYPATPSTGCAQRGAQSRMWVSLKFL